MTRFKIKLLIVSLLISMTQTAIITAEDTNLTKAKQILQKSPIIDGHNDLPWVIRSKFKSDVEGYDISVPAQYDTDIPRLKAGMIGTQFWSVYVPSSLTPAQALTTQLEQIDIAKRMINQYPKTFGYAVSVADIKASRASGHIGSLLGIEGGHSIANSLGALRSYYDLGVRYMTLTHFHSNDWADSATDTDDHNGLTAFGKEVVREMNRLGMIVDLSHVSAATMNDALDVTEAPVMFSHSSARAMTNHSRNVPDDVLKRVTTNGGVVMVTFVPPFVNTERRDWAAGMIALMKDTTTDAGWDEVSKAYRKKHGEPPLANLSDVADHIDHVAKVAGFNHVGIGGDFYGAEGDDLVSGLEDVSKYPNLIAELLRRGWTDKNLAKLTSGNILRVFSGVEQVSTKLKKTKTPSLKTIEELDGI